jgi:YVTN family beta-propeller protein
MTVRRAALLLCLALAARADAGSFVNFESGQVRPLALSADGSHLFAANTPDNRVEVFRVDAGTLASVAEVQVGLEPVALAVRGSELWVVNHLSDSVSVVDVSDPTAPRVVATLQVGDEPRDVVFARADRSRAFVTTAHRGQNRPGDPQLITPGVGRADVWVFDATNRTAAPTVLTLFADTPRALAVTPDGATVYAAAFQSGNQTTSIPETEVSSGGGLPPFPPGATPGAPPTGLIVHWDGMRWVDELARNWSSRVHFTLPDEDVFAIDATVEPPAVTAAVAHVGTVLFNMAVHPGNGRVYVGNLESRNAVRFEPVLRGHLAESRITVIDGTTATPHHLNPHINYTVDPGPPSEIAASLAFPLGLAFGPGGDSLWVAAFGSAKVAKLDTAALEAGSVQATRVAVGGGPTGLVFDEPRGRVYVLNRFDETISVIDAPSVTVVATVPLRYDPSPAVVRKNRHHLYDATISGHGDSACASCHVFGDFDSLAWDLGDPFGAVAPEFGPAPPPGIALNGGFFHPLKGPMTTQSLRGMAGQGPMHWRGDRNGGDVGHPESAELAFKKFNPAFVSLLGAAAPLSTNALQEFTDFVLTLRYPPNPIANLDQSETPAQTLGREIFTVPTTDIEARCEGCHVLPFGSAGFMTFEAEPQEFKVAHFRNAYQKIGMFGSAAALGGGGVNDGFLGDQVRGFGFLHDGSIATVFNFLHAPVFTLDDGQRRLLEQFVLATTTGLAPIVGQQVTVDAANLSAPATTARVGLLVNQAIVAGNCDLVVKGRLGGEARGWLLTRAGTFLSDRASEAPISQAALLAQAATPGEERTYTCVPPGSGTRIGIDRDEDGVPDRTEIDQGTPPGDPGPGGNSGDPKLIPGTLLALNDHSGPPPRPRARRIRFVGGQVTPPARGSAGDPTLGGATLAVYNAEGTGEKVVVDLAMKGWRAVGRRSRPKGFTFRARRGPIASVVVARGKIVVAGGGASFRYTLDEPAQLRIAVRLTLGTDAGWCAVVTPRSTGRPPSTAKTDRVDRFLGGPSPAPSSCPTLP